MKSSCRRHGPSSDQGFPFGRFYRATKLPSERLKAVQRLIEVSFAKYYCADCDTNVVVDKHGRCTVCGSDAVVRDTTIHTMNRSTTDNVAPPQHGGCNNDKEAPKEDEAPKEREKP